MTINYAIELMNVDDVIFDSANYVIAAKQSKKFK